MQELFSQVDLGVEPLWPLDFRKPRPGLVVSIVFAAAVGVGFGLLCAAGHFLSYVPGHVATFRPADGVLTAFLLCRPRNRWWPLIFAAWLGGAISILVLGSPLVMSGAVAFCNVVEVLIAALLLKGAVDRYRDLACPAVAVRFLLFAVLLAPATSALLASAYYHLAFGAHFWRVFGKWFPPYALGMAMMTPLTLAIWNPNLKKLFGRQHCFQTVGVLLLILVVTIVIFEQKHYSLRFLWMPVLMLVVVEVGVLGAVMATFEILLIGSLYTMHGRGLLWMDKGSTLRGNILILQSGILVLLVSVAFFAAVVERQRQLRSRLRLGLKRYRLLADNSRDIVVLANLEGRRLYVSPAVYDVLGWTPQEWTNQDAADYMHWKDLGAFQRMLKEMIHGEDRRTFRYRTRHKNGQYLWMEASVRTLPDEVTGEPQAFVANVRDISERVESDRKLAEANEQVQQQAQRDSLTQLANRRRFDEVLEREWRRGRRTGEPLALLLVDIDRFKQVNDTCGHRAGDQCLQILAAILQRASRRPGDLSARYGGDEFAVLLPDVNLAAAMAMAEGICQQVREQLFEVGVGRSLTLTVSIGIAAQVPDKVTRADALVGAADLALYAAKQAGRDRIMPDYEPEVSATPLHQLQ